MLRAIRVNSQELAYKEEHPGEHPVIHLVLIITMIFSIFP